MAAMVVAAGIHPERDVGGLGHACGEVAFEDEEVILVRQLRSGLVVDEHGCRGIGPCECQPHLG
jgi:hypothetical protein